MDELESLKNQLQNALAEKTAIDQLCMMHIKDNVVLRTQLVLFQENNKTLTSELLSLKEKLNKENKTEEVIPESNL